MEKQYDIMQLCNTGSDDGLLPNDTKPLPEPWACYQIVDMHVRHDACLDHLTCSFLWDLSEDILPLYYTMGHTVKSEWVSD